MKKPKVQKAYRLQERTVRLIEAIAVEAGYSAQADTIDMWAKEWVDRNGKPTWWDDEEGSEKKSGRRGEVFADDVPDDLPAVVKKKLPILPVGVTTAAKLEKKATVMGKSVRTLGDDGKIYINGVAQVSNLRDERLARANAGPILRPGQRK